GHPRALPRSEVATSAAAAAFEVLDDAAERVQPGFPCLAVLVDPFRGGLQRRGLQPAGTPLGVTAPGDEAGPLENLQVLRDGLEAHGERLGQLADRRVTGGQARQDRPPGAIGERGEGGIELVLVERHTQPLSLSTARLTMPPMYAKVKDRN